MELIVIAIIIGLIVYGLEHNRTRQPHPHLTGSTDIADRDNERLTIDLSTR